MCLRDWGRVYAQPHSRQFACGSHIARGEGKEGRGGGWGVDDESDAKANWCVV